METQLTDSQFLARLRENKIELMKLNDGKTLKIEAQDGLNTKYDITVNGPCYLYSSGYTEPRLSMGPHKLKLTIPREFPFKKPIICFVNENDRLAHVNVFPHGTVCIGDHWDPGSHDLAHAVKKMMKAITFMPEAINFSSMADANYKEWMKKMLLKRNFPTFTWFPPEERRVKKA